MEAMFQGLGRDMECDGERLKLCTWILNYPIFIFPKYVQDLRKQKCERASPWHQSQEKLKKIVLRYDNYSYLNILMIHRKTKVPDIYSDQKAYSLKDELKCVVERTGNLNSKEHKGKNIRKISTSEWILLKVK